MAGEMTVKAGKIYAVRKRLGLSMTAFALRCGYSSSSIFRIERGEYAAGEELCKKICAVYGVNENWLFYDENTDDSQMFEQEKKYGEQRDKTESAEIRTQGERLREVFEKSGLSQRDFCEKIGSSTSNLQDLMNDRRKLTARYAEKIEKAFAVGADWLLFGIEEAKEYPCGNEMIGFLKQNPEVRKLVREKMEKMCDK